MKSFIKYNLYLAVLLFPGFSHAATLEFGCITNNSGNCGSITSLFSLDVTDEGDGNTLFKFTLADGDNAAIMEIFFDDEQLGLLNPLSATLDENGGTDLGGGVDFGDIEVPGDNFPAGNTISFTEVFVLNLCFYDMLCRCGTHRGRLLFNVDIQVRSEDVF